jgi:hypothetical protein
MNYTAKIVQIIKYEDKKNYGFIDYPNHDYLNIRPTELVKEEETFIWSRKVIGISLLILFGIIALNQWWIHFKYFSGISWILVVSIIVFALWFSDYRSKKVFNKYWYFDAPLPIEKPHNYNVGDIVNINIEIKKVK